MQGSNIVIVLAGVGVEDVSILFDEVHALGSPHGWKLLKARVQRLANRAILTEVRTTDAELFSRLRAQVPLPEPLVSLVFEKTARRLIHVLTLESELS